MVFATENIKPAIFYTKEVKIGDVPLGAKHPIRIQSMTTSDTMDTNTTVKQCISLINAGCHYIRITAPSINEANNLANIKKNLAKLGYHTPLIADIHYTPNAAETAARIVEKVRINPGNYLKTKIKKQEYDKYDHEQEQEAIIEHIKPLIQACKQYGTALRIGVNHGSLSDRILNTYGNTPTGMVYSALEFINACQLHNYNDIVISMKSSNVNVMIQAYELLVKTMINKGMNYPLHLGLTEAGNGQDGRIKSSTSIGYLLSKGIGDTIRVSLTESPEKEIPPAKILASIYSKEKIYDQIAKLANNPLNSQKGSSSQNEIQSYNYPVVISTTKEGHQPHADYHFDITSNSLIDNNNKYHYLHNTDVPSCPEYINIKYFENQISHNENQIVYILEIPSPITLEQKEEIQHIINNINGPIILKIDTKLHNQEEILISTSVTAASILTQNSICGIWLNYNNKHCTSSAFAILQALGKRKTRAEYIACPGCGRTLFNLETITKEIQEKTTHLKNLKIGVMGCIVNGPGEMAGSDYGYVGAGKGKIHLYRGEQIAEKNIPSSQAVNKLIELIKKDGKWINP